ncbi:MAG: spondin domain-containing protein [Acidobacteriota bacterium]|nr:MAG: spondin domain-containing protein [Acidobacteriota bacterium]
MNTKNRFSKLTLNSLFCLLFCGAGLTSVAQANQLTIEVEITNLTKGQIFSPGVVALHTAWSEPIFRVGSPSSEELAGVAEDAILDPLVARLESDPDVAMVGVIQGENVVILPGETATIRFAPAEGRKARRLSLVGMLVTTNDAFYGLNSVAIGSPFLAQTGTRKTEDFYALAYDAGSERNTETCDSIPGPPCGNPMVRVTDGAEGYVYVHSGIHGSGDLSPAEYDWNNPVAKVVVRVGP